MDLKRFNRWMLLIFGSLFFIGALLYIILSLMEGREISITPVVVMIGSLIGAYYGFRDLRLTLKS